MLNFFKNKFINNTTSIVSPVSGLSFPIEEVKDEMFSGKMMGDGIAFDSDDSKITAPCTGKLVSVFPGGHAYGIKMDNGIEVLLHLGVDTVNLHGRGFHVLVKQGQYVHCGDSLVRLDRKLIDKECPYFPIMLVITNTNQHEIRKNIYGKVEQSKTEIIQWNKIEK